MSDLKRFSVTVTRDTTESVTVEIEATDEADAQEKAIAFTYDNAHLTWEQDDTPNASKEHYANGAEEV